MLKSTKEEKFRWNKPILDGEITIKNMAKAAPIMRQRYNIIHCLIDPGKPNQNGKAERSHRKDQERNFMEETNNEFLMLSGTQNVRV